MHRKTIAVSCGEALAPSRVRDLFAHMDAEVSVLKVPLSDALAAHRGLGSGIDLFVVDATSTPVDFAVLEESLRDGAGQSALLALVNGTALPDTSFPVRMPFDFACEGASDEELKLRCRRLLWPGEATSDADFLQVGPMSINLATYQVKVDDDPIDLTYMEYELLSFLVTHPDRIYSREVLLSQVWGFDYYGGSRTVDVHVRRLRAKLGPEVAQRIETVRGAGYLWSN